MSLKTQISYNEQLFQKFEEYQQDEEAEWPMCHQSGFIKFEEMNIPRTIKDLDNFNVLLTKFDPDLDQNYHPGFSDSVYRERRSKIAELAINYRSGEKIPNVDYTEDELRTWKNVYETMKQHLPKHMCKEQNQALEMFEQDGIYSSDRIPQLEYVSNYLKSKSGFQLRPAGGLLTSRDFLASLALKVFQCTQYTRHPSNPHHTVEPDCIHDLFGHIPLLADPDFSKLTHEIGLASLGASDNDIEKLVKLYWFTIEFGLCMQDGEIRAYGAGLMSSYGELGHALSDVPEKKKFDIQSVTVQEYDDQNYQEVYFIAQSFADVIDQVRQFARSIKKNFEVKYDHLTESIQLLDI